MGGLISNPCVVAIPTWFANNVWIAMGRTCCDEIPESDEPIVESDLTFISYKPYVLVDAFQN